MQPNNNLVLVKTMYYGWYQATLIISWVVAGGFSQLLGGFRWFQVVPRFSKYRTSQCWLRVDVPIFVQKFTSYKLLYKTLVDCDSQPLETLE